MADVADFEAAAARAYAEGRREQRCPACGREEAGGSYCTGCCRRVHPDEWRAVSGRRADQRRAASAGRKAACADSSLQEPRSRPRRPQTPPRPAADPDGLQVGPWAAVEGP